MDKEELKKLANLARIEIDDKDSESLQGDMKAILKYISQIQEVSGENEEDAPAVGLLHNVMREDENPHEAGIYTEVLLEAAPAREGDYVKVKKIL